MLAFRYEYMRTFYTLWEQALGLAIGLHFQFTLFE